MIDFAAAYDVVDSQTRETVGTLRRRGFASLVRDNWEVLDDAGRSLGTVTEDGTAMALLRRFLEQPDPADLRAARTGRRKQRRSPSVSTP